MAVIHIRSGFNQTPDGIIQVGDYVIDPTNNCIYVYSGSCFFGDWPTMSTWSLDNGQMSDTGTFFRALAENIGQIGRQGPLDVQGAVSNALAFNDIKHEIVRANDNYDRLFGRVDKIVELMSDIAASREGTRDNIRNFRLG